MFKVPINRLWISGPIPSLNASIYIAKPFLPWNRREYWLTRAILPDWGRWAYSQLSSSACLCSLFVHFTSLASVYFTWLCPQHVMSICLDYKDLCTITVKDRDAVNEEDSPSPWLHRSQHIAHHIISFNVGLFFCQRRP